MCISVYAASPSKPFAFTGGTGISASQMNSNFDVLYNWESNSWTSLGGTNLGYNGWVGIGSSSPFCTMELRGALNDLLMVNSTIGGAGNLADIAFRTYSGSGVSARIGAVDAGNHNGSLSFQVADSGVVSTNTVEAMRIISNGYVGIGTTTPTAQLQVSGGPVCIDEGQFIGIATASQTFSYDGMTVGSYGLGWYPDTAFNSGAPTGILSGWGGIKLMTLNSCRMTVTEGGYVGIGTTTPVGMLDVEGSNATVSPLVVKQLYNSGTAGDGTPVVIFGGNINGASSGLCNFFRPDGVLLGGISEASGSSLAYNTTSDRRLKENIQDTHFSLVDLMKIQVRDFNYKKDAKKTLITGFIAQELENVFPCAVTVGATENDFWAVDYGKLTPLLVKAVQDQQKEIEDLKKQNEDLKQRLAAVEKKLGI
jgi:hypothetical protein